MITRAEKVADGSKPLKKDRFVKIDDTSRGVDWGLVQRARDLAELKGYVTNLAVEVMDGQAARPIFHHVREPIEAHLTIVFTALAVARYLQQAGGVSIRKLVQTLQPLRTAVIEIAGHRITAQPEIPPPADEILAALRGD